ncbi:cytochrome P450 [Aspergillus candidus]|uniref:Cytochrome P450 n=1 Tax=Aspergillus candidus TaxID=41067 RepID=A0A2I2FKN2_ASPCN|nr:cytochrome P450 [Aspergillus candidus]PLB41186.1 cytochrome P450 [Aspergillus candidus]
MESWLGSPRFNEPVVVFVVVIVGVAFIHLMRIFRQGLKRRELERLRGCEKLPNENDRFRYDIFGVAKTVELAFHFQRRTSLEYTNALFTRYGETYTSHLIGYRLIFTHNRENIQHLLSTAFVDFDSSPLRKPLFQSITPHGIFTLDGADWKKSRGQLSSRLSDLRRIIDLEGCERHFQAFLQHVPSNNQAFDIQSCVFALSLDIQTGLSLGESIDALDPCQSPEKKQFEADLLHVKERIVQDGFRGPLRHLRSKRTFIQSCRRAREYVMAQATREVRQRSHKRKRAEVYPVKAALDAEAEEVSQFTDQALGILLANDSIGTTLSGLFYCLSQDERVVHKLRASIIDTLGLTSPTWKQLGSLGYVRCVIQEVMRLFPAVVLNARVANKDSIMPRGGGRDGDAPALVRAGDIVVFSTWARHRLGNDFGENPQAFYPERWEHLSGDMPGYIPFNKGPRACPGRHYAMIILTYLVARLFQTYSRVSNYNTQPWTEKISMTFENDNGVFVGLS